MFMFQVLFAIIQPLIASGMGKKVDPAEPGKKDPPKQSKKIAKCFSTQGGGGCTCY